MNFVSKKLNAFQMWFGVRNTSRVLTNPSMSILDYGDIIYTQASALKVLDVIYHSALRFTNVVPFPTHCCILYSHT